jgi:hypothetical protein
MAVTLDQSGAQCLLQRRSTLGNDLEAGQIVEIENRINS